jgi:hypothetical protein
MKPSIASKCVICEYPFMRMRPLQVVCGPVCAYQRADVLAAKKKHSDAKADRADTAARKLAMKSRSDWEGEIQAICNRIARIRDDKEPCISCRRHHSGQYHGGHFLSVGAHPALRFNMQNINKQCKPCNVDLSGNHHFYRIGMIAKYGADVVDSLECHESDGIYTKPTIEQLKALKAAKQAELKSMLAANTVNQVPA